MDKEYTSSADRLLKILEKASSYKPDRKTHPDSMMAMWAHALGLPLSQPRVVVMGVAQVMTLIEEVKQEINDLNGIDHQLYLDSFPPIEKYLRYDQLSAPCSDAINVLCDRSTLQGLRFCADKLNNMAGETKIDDTVLGELLDKIHQTQKEIAQSDLCSELKFVLCEQLDDICRSIREYKIFGIDALVDAYKSSVGAVAAHGGLLSDDAKKSSGVRAFVDRVNEVGDVIESVDATGQRLYRLAGLARRAIGRVTDYFLE